MIAGMKPGSSAIRPTSGIKRATASAYELYAFDGEPLPKPGEYSVILNSHDEAVCIIKTTAVYVVRFCGVTEEFAFKEGEGDRSLAYWKKAHERFFTEQLKEAGLEFSPEMKVVCEQFELVYAQQL